MLTESMRRLKVDDANGGVGDELGSYPDRPGEPNCIYYLRTGSCGYGSNCRFNHPSNPEQVRKDFSGFYVCLVADSSGRKVFLNGFDFCCLLLLMARCMMLRPQRNFLNELDNQIAG